jgi:hypothetical protein
MDNDFASQPFDVFVQGGQSNSDGTGFGDVEKPFVPTENIMYMFPGGSIETARERHWDNMTAGDLSLSFAESYINNGLLAPGRKILILRGAVGGTGFLDHRWRPGDDLHENLMGMIKKALSLNSQNRPIVFLWHQGETDAGLKASCETHTRHLATLINNVREACAAPMLPFICADFVQEWKDVKDTTFELVERAMRKVCANDPYAMFVETDGLASNNQQYGGGDTIHFSRAALQQLGIRYFNAFQKINL